MGSIGLAATVSVMKLVVAIRIISRGSQRGARRRCPLLPGCINSKKGTLITLAGSLLLCGRLLFRFLFG